MTRVVNEATERENGGALPEGTDTAVSAADTRASRAVDASQSSTVSRVAVRQMARFLRALAEMPEPAKLDRYRENNGLDAVDFIPAMCEGARDAHGLPSCEGPDVVTVETITPEGTRTDARWCVDCRAAAMCQGYVIVRVIRTPEPLCVACGVVPVFLRDRCAGCHATDRRPA